MKTLFVFALAFVGLLAHASEKNDTIVRVLRPDSVLFTRNDSVLQLRINGAENDATALFTYTVSKYGTSIMDKAASRWRFPENPLKYRSSLKHNASWEASTLDFMFGFNLPVDAPKSVGGSVWGRNIDFELNIIRFSLYLNKHHRISAGWSYGWTKLGLEGDKCFHLDNGIVSIGDFVSEHTPLRSVFRLNRHAFPLLYTYEHKGYTLSFGPVLNANVRPRIYNTFVNEKGIEYQDVFKHGIHYTPLSVSWLAEVKKNSLGFFVRYSPTSVFEKNFGPDIPVLTVGLSLF